MFSFRRWWSKMAAAAAFACMSVAQGAPSLTTIQDILYKADGTRFNGTITISWTNFNTADASTIPVQSVTAQVVNGVLNVQLVPTTNGSAGASYVVKYSSQGRFQFTESWAVPPSTTALRIRDVRVSSGSVVGPPPVLTQMEIGDVTGLVTELNQRPSRGISYGPSRAAVINSSGQIDAAAGNLDDCVRVDGTSGPCGTGGSGGAGSNVTFADGETPLGYSDGGNAVFTIGFVPQPAASLALYRNGVLLKPGVDFTLSGKVITFAADGKPQLGDLLTASYRYLSDIPNQPVVTANFVDAETPGGAADGVNTGYSLAQTPAPVNSLQFYRNGVLMKQGFDYSLAGNIVTFVSAAIPQAGDLLQASYRYGASAGTMTAAAPQILCGATGSAIGEGGASLGSCTIPANTLAVGDRVEIRFEYAHTGTASTFGVQIRWGGSLVLDRSSGADEPAMSGRIDAGIFAGGSQWSSQSWGAIAGLATGSGTANAATDAPIIVDFAGSLAAGGAGDELALRNFTVLRYPATN